MITTQILNFRFTMMIFKSITNSIITYNIKKVMRQNLCLLVLAFSILLSGVPLFAKAQSVPLMLFQDSVIGKTPQDTKEAVEKAERKIAKPKITAEMKKKKEYKEDKSIKIKDPEGFYANQKNRLFSGPQSGEILPPFQVKGIDGKKFDIAAQSDGEPIVLFLQDANGVGIKGLVNVISILLKIDSLYKRHIATDGEKSNSELHIGVVLLADEIDALPEWAQGMLKDEMPDVIKKGISQDGREGPGSYGLNRNVSQTVLVVKDGKVLHNFAFVQPMLYADSYLLGAVAQAIEVESEKLEKWLNADTAKKDNGDKLDAKSLAAKLAEIQKAIKNGKISRDEAAEWLRKLDITWEEGQKLLEKEQQGAKAMDRKMQYENRRQVRIADPKDFRTSQNKQIFSGPQPGEKLPPLKATTIRGEAKGKTFDFITEAEKQPILLLLQDESGVGLRGLYDISRMVEKIGNESKQELQMSVVFFSDDQAALRQITQHVPKNVSAGISPDGREGPGSYGLNRNVSQTVIIAKGGKVLYNFAFTQPLLFAEPHILGAIAEVIQEQPETVAKWLNERPAQDERKQRGRERMQREGEREASPEERMRRDEDPKVSPEGRQMERQGESDRERTPSKEELVKRFDKDGDGKLNQEEGLAARRALASRGAQNRYRNIRVEVKNPADFKKTQENEIYSGPQPGEKLPHLNVNVIKGEKKNITLDFTTMSNDKPIILFLQDETPSGLRGLVGFCRLLSQISEKSKLKLHKIVLFLGDSPDTLSNQVSRLRQHIPSDVFMGLSPDGREGPGNYGLNRHVAQTVIIAKDGKVLHNFAFTQPSLYPDPYVLGAIAEAIDVQPNTLEKWLNEEQANSQKMEK